MIPPATRGRSLLAGLLLASGACTQSDLVSPPDQALEPALKISKEVEKKKPVRPSEAGFFALAEHIPGFGGYEFDDEGNLVAFIKGRTKGGDDKAQALLRRLLDRRRSALKKQGGVVILKTGDFTFDQLATWRDQLTDSLLGRGLGVRSTDIDEGANRIRIGVGGSAGRAAVMRAALEAGIPSSALVMDDETVVESEGAASLVTAPPLADHPSANGEFYGGMRIVRPDGTQSRACTLGFYARIGGVAVGVSNSHCSRDRDSNGGDGTLFYNSVGNYRGAETHDRNHHDWCPQLLSPFRYCRNADAMLFRAELGSPTPAFRKILRYKNLNPGSIQAAFYHDIDANNPIVIGSRYEARAGELVNKAGIATGWTQGVVSATCKDVEVWVVPIVAGHIYRCQHEASYGRADGDSGAPVFSFSFGLADLKGIHWGRYFQVTGMKTVFSPLSGIEADFGQLGELPSGGPGYIPPAPGCDPVTAIIPC